MRGAFSTISGGLPRMDQKGKRGKRILRAAILVLGSAAVVWLCTLFYGRITRLIDSNAQIAAQQARLLNELTSVAPTSAPMSYDWIPEDNPIVAHALGGIDGHAYTNSLEAFEASYARGQRVFEADISITEDMQLVCAHDAGTWREAAGAAQDTPFTGANFRASRLYGRFTPLTLTELIDLIAKYPDAVLITDTKYSDRNLVQFTFSTIVTYARRNCPDALTRIVPQIYDENMYAYIMEVHPFRSMIYTLYNTETNMQLACDFCRRVGIGFITVSWKVATPLDFALAESLGIRAAVHTVNDAAIARELLSQGATMIYSDTLTPEALE